MRSMGPIMDGTIAPFPSAIEEGDVMSAAKRTGTLAVFYNGECPVCRPGIDHCRALSEAEGQRHRWIDIAADPAAATLVAAPLETIRRRLHVIDRD